MAAMCPANFLRCGPAQKSYPVRSRPVGESRHCRLPSIRLFGRSLLLFRENDLDAVAILEQVVGVVFGFAVIAAVCADHQCHECRQVWFQHCAALPPQFLCLYITLCSFGYSWMMGGGCAKNTARIARKKMLSVRFCGANVRANGAYRRRRSAARLMLSSARCIASLFQVSVPATVDTEH